MPKSPRNFSPHGLSQRASEQQFDQQRRNERPSRRWYNLARWRKLRLHQLEIEPLCRFCAEAGQVTAANVCDHVEPHNEIEAAFWAGPFQSLCDACHNADKQQIDRALRAAWRPDWMRRSLVPVTLVCGPPLAGKSQWVAQQLGRGDLVIDLDVIASGMAGSGLHTWDRSFLIPAVRARNDLLGKLSKPPVPWVRVWFVLTEPDAERRAWWRDRLGADSIVLAIEADTCHARLADDAERAPRADIIAQAIDDWWRRFTVQAGERIER